MNNVLLSAKCLSSRLFLVALLSLLLSLKSYGEEEKPRIVSVGGALTEVIYQLGVEDQLVGVDTTSLYPETATQLPQVGYQRALSAEGILSLNPTIVLVTDQAGPPAVIEQIRLSGVKLVVIPTVYSAKGVANKIEAVASALGKTEQGKKISHDFLTAMKTVSNEVKVAAKSGKKPRVLFLMNAGKGSPMAAGESTAANAMLELSGAGNAIQSFKGYKPLSTEALVAADPEIILLPKRTLQGLGGEEKVLRMPGIMVTTAGRNEHVVAMESLYLLGFTPRLPEAIGDLRQLLFGDE